MREGNATDVGRCGRETHGGNDVRRVGGELWSGENNAFGRAGSCGREFEMGAIRRKSADGRRRLVRFEGTRNGVSAPGAKEVKNEGGCGSARIDNWIGTLDSFGLAEEIGKGPGRGGGGIEQGEFA